MEPSNHRLESFVVRAVGLAAIVSALMFGVWMTGAGPVDHPPLNSDTTLAVRAKQLSGALSAVEEKYKREVWPIEQMIRSKQPDSTLARNIAWEIITQAHRVGVPTDVAVGILLVENPQIEPNAVSSAGAVGLFQVMPFHAGKWGCGKKLKNIRTNICTGLTIYKHHLWEFNGDRRRALLAYNGCTGSNPECLEYPKWVQDKTRKFRRTLRSSSRP